MENRATGESGPWELYVIEKDRTELVSAPGAANPIAVRYAYTAQPLGHLLYNTDGMPVASFATDIINP